MRRSTSTSQEATQHPLASEEFLWDDREDSLSESETVVAVFRTLLFVVILVAPHLNQDVYRLFPKIHAAIVAAGVYTLLMSLALHFHLRFRYQRVLIVAVDMLLITLFIFACGSGIALQESGLFPLYYLVVLVAALWFRVVGALLMAAFSSFIYILGLIYFELYLRDHPIGDPLVDLFTMNIPMLFLVALLSGYMAEAWEAERQRRLRAQMVLEEFRRQIILARHLQEILLPHRLPKVQGLEVGVAHRPAKVVGGDYYDVLELDGGWVGVCLADVAGKQVLGQMYLPLLKYSLRAATLLFEAPGRILGSLNRMLFPELHPDRFISMTYAILHPERGEMVVANAGHLPLFHYRPANETITLLFAEGIVLGVEAEPRYEERRERLEPGDWLVMVTDGVTEAVNEEGRPFGLEGVRMALQKGEKRSAQQLAEALLEQVNAYEAGEKVDDATVLVIHWPSKASSTDASESPPGVEA